MSGEWLWWIRWNFAWTCIGTLHGLDRQHFN